MKRFAHVSEKRIGHFVVTRAKVIAPQICPIVHFDSTPIQSHVKRDQCPRYSFSVRDLNRNENSY